MRKKIAVVSFLVGVFSAIGQTTSTPSRGLATDPHEIFKAAAPLYDFDDAALKPWHVKAHYQLFDAMGKPGETGSFEYWWASPHVHRRTWTRLSASRSEWSTEDGKHFYQASGESLHYFERNLPALFLSPLPPLPLINSPHMVLLNRMTKAGNAQFPCIMLVPEKIAEREASSVLLGTFATYCFDQNLSALRFSYSEGVFTTVFNRIEKMQGHYLPMETRVMAEDKTVFALTVDSVLSLDPLGAVLKPSVDATEITTPHISLSYGVAEGILIKKVQPDYPPVAKSEKLQGIVVLQVRIGIDGEVHDPEVIVSPGSVLTKAALDAVSQWKYRPYLFKGVPVDVSSEIHVIFSMPR